MPRNPTMYVLVAVALLSPPPASAQRLSDAVAATSNSRTDFSWTRRQETVRAPQGKRLIVRTLGGVLGLGVGTAVGLVIGGGAFDCTDCTVPVFALLGGVIGGVAGTAAGVAIPSFSSECSGAHRFWRGFGGAIVGGMAGSLASVSNPHNTPWQIGTVVVGMSFGAALFQGHC